MSRRLICTPPSPFAAYVVCLDHAYEAIVLAIRGTHGLHDLLTDAAATNTAFLTGYAHSGMAHAVATLLGDTPVLQERVIVSSAGAAAATSTTRAADGSGEVLLGVARLLASCMKQHPSYRVVVCGHSLGGGVAALLTMRLFYLLDFDAAAQAKCGFGIRVAQSPGGSTVPAADAQAPLTAPTVTVTMHDDDNEDGFVHVTSSPPASSSSSSLPGPAPPKSAWPLQPYPLHCFVFGPPPVASVDVCEHFEPHITSTVMGADFVPRVSMHMLHRLRREVHASRHLWWQDAVVDLAASRVGQLSTTAVQHMSHALLAAKDLSSAALGNLCYFLQQRFAGDGRASSAAPPSDTNAVQMQEADQTHSSSNATASSSPGGSSPGASSEASDVYVELARDFIRAQHPNSAAGAQVDELLRVGIQQGQPERVINSGDDILQREMGELDADQGGDPRAAGSDDSSDAAPSTPPPGRSGPDRDLADSPGSVGSDCELPLQVLSLPGTILHVTPHEDRQVFGYEARIVPPSHFEQMLFTHDMWQHHKRRLYGRALQWINLRDTPQPRVQMRLPAHLLPSPAAGAVGGSGRARAAHLAAQAKARATVLVPACAVPNQGTPFDAEAFLRSVVGSPANLGSAACSAAANDASDVMSEASPNSLQ